MSMFLTNQEAFDISVGHLLKQGEQSKDLALCRYRDSRGLKCAIGALIPDDWYHPSMEGKSILTIQIDFEGLQNIFDIHLASGLQRIHDNVDPEHWPAEARRLAEKFNLKTTVINKWENK